MEFKEFVRKPFIVEAVQITLENMSEIASLVGELKETDDGRPFIMVDRKLVPNVYRVYPGFWMTRMGDHLRCYSPKVFREQFVPSHDQIRTMVDFINNGSVENSRLGAYGRRLQVNEAGLLEQASNDQEATA